MIMGGLAGIAVYILGTFAMLLFAIWRYPSEIIKDDLRFMRRFRFLFHRWTPECYWFYACLLSRNSLIAILPMIVPMEFAGLKTISMQFAIFGYLLVACLKKPWRINRANHL